MPSEPGKAGQKAVNKDYCFRHAQMYEGWECPLCAADKKGGPPAAAPSAAGGRQASGAVPEPGHAAPPASRSASRSRSEQAQHVLDAGDARAALEVCAEAIDLDRTNLHAFLVAVKAAQRVGEFRLQEEFAEDAGRLLRDPEYRLVGRWYVDLVKSLRDAAMARPIVEAFVAAGPWPPADALDIVRTLISRGFPGEALRVLDAVPAAQRSLALCAYNAQLTKRGFGINDPEVDAHLSRIAATERDGVLRELREMCDSGDFSISTLLLLRDAVRNRYRQWTPEIGQDLERAARADLAEKVRPQAAQRAIGLALRLGGGALGVAIVLGLLLGGSILVFLVGVLLAAAVATGAYVYVWDAEVTRRVNPLVAAEVQERTRRERDAWHLVLDDGAAPFAMQASEAAATPGKESQPATTEPAAAGSAPEGANAAPAPPPGGPHPA